MTTLTMADIAARYGISVQAISNRVKRMQKAGLPFPPAVAGTRPRQYDEHAVVQWFIDSQKRTGIPVGKKYAAATPTERDEIVRTYRECHSLKETAQLTGFHTATIKRVLAAHGLYRRCTCAACTRRGVANLKRLRPELFDPVTGERI